MKYELVILLFLIACISLLVDIRSTPDEWSAMGRRVRLVFYTITTLLGGAIVLELGHISPVSALILLPVVGLSTWQIMRIWQWRGVSHRWLRVLAVGLVLGMLGVAQWLPEKLPYFFTVEYILGRPLPYQESINPDAEYRVRV